jgi:hypothetical protein
MGYPVYRHGFLLAGGVWLAHYVEPQAGFVTPSDMKAMQWIRENSPADPAFTVNTAVFSFRPQFMIGIDAGYWIPLLPRRGTVSLPMVYGPERTSGLSANNLVRLHLAGGDLIIPTRYRLA